MSEIHPAYFDGTLYDILFNTTGQLIRFDFMGLMISDTVSVLCCGYKKITSTSID